MELLLKRNTIFLTFFFITSTYAQDYPPIDESVRIHKLNPPNGKVRTVFDTDTYNEIDDQFALVYALLSPEHIDLKAVYAAPFSNVRASDPGEGMEKSYEEILKNVRVSKDFIEIIEEVATEKGLLPKKNKQD